MIYYKATRPDGTDFRTGTVRYEVGKRTVHPTSTKRTRNYPSTYLSVSTVPTDCTGFRWPCRLFAVKGVGRAMKADDLPNKRAFLAVDVIEELPAHEVFGPQSEQVVALIERAKKLTTIEVKQMYDLWNATRSTPKTAAWNVAGRIVRNVARTAAWDAVRDAGWDAAGYTPGYAARGLVVRDLIRQHGFTQAHYDILTGPWRKMVGKVHPDDE